MLYTGDVSMMVARIVFLITLAAAARPPGNIACPGACVALHFTQYCETLLDSPELCVEGKICCISEDSTLDVGEIIGSSYSVKPSPVMSPSAGAATQKPGSTCSGECVSRIIALFCDNVHEELTCPGEEVCCMPEEMPSSTTKKPTQTTTIRPDPECRGKCTSGMFSLFCDHVDQDATCPGDDVCCIKDDIASTIYTSTTAVE